MRAIILADLIFSEEGVTAIEYALLSSLIAVIILTAVTTVGSQLLALWNRISNCVTFAVDNTGNCS